MRKLPTIRRFICRWITDLFRRICRICGNRANPGLSTRSYTLNASFPPKPLMDESLTLQEAGLLNAVVIQKFQ